jgi:hypothetical protein
MSATGIYNFNTGYDKGTGRNKVGVNWIHTAR